MSEVLVPLAEGFEEIEAVTIIDLLRRAGVGVTTASITNRLSVKGAHGIEVRADSTLPAVSDRTYQAVILPGGMPGTTNLAADKTLGEVISRHQQRGEYLAAICAAPTVLAKHGVLQGKKATCYPGFEEQLSGARTVKDSVVEDGKVLTSRGPGTAIPFALKLIEKLVGAGKAAEIKNAILA